MALIRLAQGCCAEVNEHSCYTKNEEFIDQLGDYLILQEGPASCS